MTKPKDGNSSSPSEKKAEQRSGATGSSNSGTKTPEVSASSLSKNKEIKKLLDMGVQRGYLTYVEVNELLPPEFIASTQIDEIMNLLAENEIEVIDALKRPKDAEEGDEESEESPLGAGPAPAAEGEAGEG